MGKIRRKKKIELIPQFCGVMVGEAVPIHARYFTVDRVEHCDESTEIVLHASRLKGLDWDNTGIDGYMKAMRKRKDLLPKIKTELEWAAKLFRQSWEKKVNGIMEQSNE